MEEEITLSSSLERIKDAVDDIRTAVDMEDDAIEDVADAVEEIAGTGYNAYTTSSLAAMGQFDIYDTKNGSICTVTNENYTYIPYSANVLTRILIFPETFTTNETPEEFSDVNFSIYYGGAALTAGGHVSLTNGGSSGSGSGSGSGSSGPQLLFDLVYQDSSSTRPCEEFVFPICYDYDSDNNEWIRNSNSEQYFGAISYIEDIHKNFIIFLPIECGFNRTGGVSLPPIISECVKMHNHQASPAVADPDGTLRQAYAYDAIFLPHEVTLSKIESKIGLINRVLNSTLDTSHSDHIEIKGNDTSNPTKVYIRAKRAGNDVDAVSIEYQIDGTVENKHYILTKVQIKDNQGKYIYNYLNYNTTYPNYDIYVYLPDRYYGGQGLFSTEWCKLFQHVDILTTNIYIYSRSNGQYWKRI